MGFFSGIKNAGGVIFNFRVTKWIGLDQIKANSKNLFNIGQSLVTPQQANYTETFEEALVRLNITEEQIQLRKKEFTRLMIIYLVIASIIFIYSIYIAYKYKNVMGFIMGFALTLFALTHAFRYHFWIYQIKHRKLGCTLRDWFLDKH